MSIWSIECKHNAYSQKHSIQWKYTSRQWLYAINSFVLVWYLVFSSSSSSLSFSGPFNTCIIIVIVAVKRIVFLFFCKRRWLWPVWNPSIVRIHTSFKKIRLICIWVGWLVGYLCMYACMYLYMCLQLKQWTGGLFSFFCCYCYFSFQFVFAQIKPDDTSGMYDKLFSLHMKYVYFPLLLSFLFFHYDSCSHTPLSPSTLIGWYYLSVRVSLLFVWFGSFILYFFLYLFISFLFSISLGTHAIFSFEMKHICWWKNNNESRTMKADHISCDFFSLAATITIVIADPLAW